jgi:hypothetical protein
MQSSSLQIQSVPYHVGKGTSEDLWKEVLPTVFALVVESISDYLGAVAAEFERETTEDAQELAAKALEATQKISQFEQDLEILPTLKDGWTVDSRKFNESIGQVVRFLVD